MPSQHSRKKKKKLKLTWALKHSRITSFHSPWSSHAGLLLPVALVPAGPSPCIAIPRSLHGWTGITQASSQVPPQRLSLITHHCLPPKCLPHPITLPHLNNLSLLRPLIWESGGFFFFPVFLLSWTINKSAGQRLYFSSLLFPRATWHPVSTGAHPIVA